MPTEAPRREAHEPVDAPLDLSLFREMADLSNDALYLNDASGQMLYVNHRGLELSGYTWDEIRTMTVSDLNPEFSLPMFQQFIAAMESSELPPFESSTRHKDGTMIPIEVSLARIEIGGRTYLFGVGRDIRQRKQLRRARRRFSQRMLQVLEAERQRVARELHDDVGQSVATIGVLLHALEQTPGALAPDARPTLEATYDMIRQVTESVARIVRDYHPAELQGLGLEDTLRQHVQQFARGRRWTVRLRTTNVAGLLSPDQELHCYRIVQEALANVARHARARRVTVHLSRRRSAIEIVVRDDGAGFDPRSRQAGEGFGLVTMRERAELMGGELTIRSRPRHGTEVRVVLPLGSARPPAAEPPAPPPPTDTRLPMPLDDIPVAPRPAADARDRAIREIPAALDLALFRQMADMSQDSFYLLDREGRFRYVNERSTVITGYSREELLQMTVFDLDPVYERVRFDAVVDALAHGALPPFETRTRRKDGSIVLTEATVARIDRHGEIWIFGVVRDLSEQKEIEAAQAAIARRLIETLEAERQRVARELHDDVGQAVATIGVLLHTLEETPGTTVPEVSPTLGTSRATIHQITESVARIVREYHPAELLGLGLGETLRSHARHFAHRHRLELDLATMPIAGLLPLEHELHLYRIAQEALGNVAQHARAQRVVVRLVRHAREVELVVRDDGRGFDPHPSPPPADGAETFGLATMRERAAITGARLHVRSHPGHGTEVRVTVPVRA